MGLIEDYNNKQSAVVSMVDIENKMMAAYGDQLKIIDHIIPLLEYRKEAARKYYEYGRQMNEDERKNFISIVEHCNNDIKKVMGL